jgi:LacI family transcriptional regulator, xylobiose transport system transcriptional regulator
VSATDADARGRTTLAMLAEEAGVSLSTISKVLNGRADVAVDTRRRVEELLDRYEYRRRGASVRSSNLLEVVFHELWSVEIIAGVEEAARDNGMSVIISVSGDRHSPGPEWVQGVLARRPAGVVLVASGLSGHVAEQLRARMIPFAVIDPSGDPSPDLPSVGSANWSGGLTATRHLLELGHRRIAMVTGPEDVMCALARLDGFRSAMGSRGVAVREDWVRFGDFDTAGGRAAAAGLFDGDDRPTAVFAGNDLMALGVIEVATEHGLRVPQDLSVVGYDDRDFAVLSRPRLTTVHQPLKKMAAAAARMVLRLGAGEPTDQRIDLATHLVVRESTAPVAASAAGSA